MRNIPMFLHAMAMLYKPVPMAKFQFQQTVNYRSRNRNMSRFKLRMNSKKINNMSDHTFLIPSTDLLQGDVFRFDASRRSFYYCVVSVYVCDGHTYIVYHKDLVPDSKHYVLRASFDIAVIVANG